MTGPRVRALLAGLALGFFSLGAWASEPDDIRRGLEAVGASVSDAAALRAEAMRDDPSPGFRLGAALRAWRNAMAGLDYDLQTPSGDGDDKEAIGIDCYDEKTAFAHLEAARVALGLGPAQVLSSVRFPDEGVRPAWISRQSGPPWACL